MREKGKCHKIKSKIRWKGVNAMLKELKANEFETLVAKADKPVVLDFTADW
ncbi:hypothetical protein BSNK01_14600 [Bacillaceae bacterium]